MVLLMSLRWTATVKTREIHSEIYAKNWLKYEPVPRNALSALPYEIPPPMHMYLTHLPITIACFRS